MKTVVKAQSLVALEKPPITWEVTEQETNLERHSSKPDIEYFFAEKVKEKLALTGNKSQSGDRQ